MKAIIICEELMKELVNNNKQIYKVHSIFNKAFNIETEGELVTILNDEKFMAPMSIKVSDYNTINFHNLELKNGMLFEVSPQYIKSLSTNLTIDLKKVTIWSPKITFNCHKIEEINLLKNIEIFEQFLIEFGKLYNIYPILQIINNSNLNIKLFNVNMSNQGDNFNFIKDRFLNFIKGIIDLDYTDIDFKAERIIGFGAGLTPAIDDFISGLMISLIYLGNYYNLNVQKILQFNKKLISKSLSKTTIISAEMLSHSAEGMTNEGVQGLMECILNKCDEDAMKLSLQKLISFGDTSGSDTALGLYVGCKIVTNIQGGRG